MENLSFSNTPERRKHGDDSLKSQHEDSDDSSREKAKDEESSLDPTYKTLPMKKYKASSNVTTNHTTANQVAKDNEKGNDTQ